MPSPDTITRVWAREVMNSRGYPTVEAEVFLADGSRGRVAAPSGISTGTHEALELWDGEQSRFGGRGALKAVEGVRQVIAPALAGMHACQQEEIDQRLLELDGTSNKAKLGGNAVLAVSLATAHAAAASQRLPLYRYLGGEGPFQMPVPTINMISGGKHAKESVDIQEFLIVPAGLSTFGEAVRAGAEVYHSLREVLRERGFSASGIGTFAPPLGRNREALDILTEAIGRAGYRLGEECFLALDVAASELHGQGRYVLVREGRSLTSGELADMWAEWVGAYPILSIEDGMDEEDWEGWRALTKGIGHKVELVGDDLFTTNPDRIRKGIELGAANAVLIKPNQIGTLTETVEAVRIARQAGWAAMMSTRSGETEDTTICDLAVALCTGQLKTAPPCIDRAAKYNRLLRIEEELGERAVYPGLSAYKAWASG